MTGVIKTGEFLERCICVHAEANAIMQCVMFGNAGNTHNATLYSTLSPCLECSKMAITVGISRIVVLSKYAEDGTEVLKQANIQLSEMNPFKLKYWLSKLCN
jgi:dCMP deaminase